MLLAFASLRAHRSRGLGLGCRVMGLGVGAIHARSSGENRQMAFRPYLEVKGKRASVQA